MPKMSELEDSLGVDGDGITGQVDDSHGGEGGGNGINEMMVMVTVSTESTAWRSYPYLSQVDTVVVASFRAERETMVVCCQARRSENLRRTGLRSIGASMQSVTRTSKTPLVVANKPRDAPE